MSMVHRAGDAVGTPAWQLDLMNGKRIEDLRNDIVPEDWFSGDPSKIEHEFNEVKRSIGQAIDHLERAYQYAKKFGREEEIGELIDRLDDTFRWDMDKLLNRFKGVS